MAAVSAPPTERARPSAGQASAASSGAGERLLSLDVFRGLTMLLLVSHGFGIHDAFKNNASLVWLANQFEHAAWAGCTLWDLIQPAFTFIVGVAIPLSTARRMAQGATRGELFRHVLWRAGFLIVLSNVLSNWNASQGLKFQLINVLCQIALGYVLCFAVMQLSFRAQAVVALAIMVFHHALFFLFPAADGAFAQTGNIGAVIDAKVLGYNYPGYYTTLNFLGNAITILFGVWTGMLLGHYRTHAKRLQVLLGCAAGSFALGLVLANWIPMVKRLWLGSFTFLSTGWVLLAFAACYWLIESKGWKNGTFPAMVVGMNCIFIYSFSQVLRGWLSRGVGSFTGKFAFLGEAGAIPHELVVMMLMWYMCYWLYQRKIFFKI